MLAGHGLQPHAPALPAPVRAARRFPRRLGDGLRCHVAVPALWLWARHQRLRRRATGADEPPAGGPKPVAAPTEEPTVRDEEPPVAAPPAAPAAPVDDPPPDPPTPDPADPPGTVPEPSSEASDHGSNDENPSLETEDELGEQIEWEDEPDEGLERIMGLEAFQTIIREPTVPPAFCSESPDRPELPICDMREEVLKQVADNRVVIIIGGTGCGKSTQVPQFIIRDSAAKQLPCNVMVTQPRRLAATSLARRVADELGFSMGVEVGYRIRGETVPGDHLSFVTAGYLLSWLTANPESVKSMTHLILDEAHIRSADMELLLLMMRLVMRINSHLRVILMSATMEADFLGNYFAEFSDKPPEALYVGGRLFPVNAMHLDDLCDGRIPGGRLPSNLKSRMVKVSKKVFKPDIMNSLGKSKADLEDLVMPKVAPPVREIVQELIPHVAEGGSTILVFIPGYADLVRMHSWLYWNLPTAGSVNMGYVPPKPDQLPEDDEEEEQEDLDEFREFQGMQGPLSEPESHHPKQAEGDEDTAGDIKFRLFALHSQVAQEDQELVLQKPPSNICNVVLATTIAESSLTLPEVIGVIDFCIHKTSIGDPSQMGLCKISAQWCARSACLQREGRAGRTQPGWCIRMVPKRLFDALREYDVPEILRTPLTTLYLKSKGIADGLSEVVANDKELQQQLSLEAATPGELLKQLLAPPMTEAIDAAVYQLAQLAVLTEESPKAKVTVLGRLALFLPLDIQLCRLVWLGCHLGCPAEAVVMAAACSTASPFSNPSRLGFQDPDEFTKHLADTAAAWRFFDAGHYSEPIALLRLFMGWLRRLSITPVRSSTPQRWFRATHMLEKDAAIDPSRMTAFVSFVADLAIRCRDLCCSERDAALACPVRAQLHGLVLLLRRPDKTRQEQQKLTDDDYVPDIGDVFRAPASKLYALLAAAFSQNLLTGSHTNAKDVDAMLDALQMLQPSGLSSQDAVLIPQHGVKRSDEELLRVLETIAGEAPAQVEQTGKFIAVRFNEEASERTPHWMKGSKSVLVSRRHDVRTMGLGPAVEPRLNAVSMAPRLCHMSAGGPRRFTIGDSEFARATSPYELEFSVVHEARGNRRWMPGLFGEQTPLGFPCHVVAPDVALGSEAFGCVASEMTLSEFGAARVNNTTLLMAEELVFSLITMCPVGITLELGFGQGPGGSRDAAHAALMGLRFHRHAEPVLFRRCLPGMKTLEKVNQVRTAIMESLVSPAETNADGQEILLWEDEETKKDFEGLVNLVQRAKTIEEMGGLYGAQSVPVFWIRHRPNLRKEEEEEEEESDEGEDESDEDEWLDEDADIQALMPITVRDHVEHTVAHKTAESSPAIEHQHECPDCGERFADWRSCMEHLVSTGHLDVSTKELEAEAKKLTQPVRWRCLECFEGFVSKKDLEQHLETTGHLSWMKQGRKKRGTHLLLCKPRPIPGLDTKQDDPQRSARAKSTARATSGGFFRSLEASLWTQSPAAQKPKQSRPNVKPEGPGLSGPPLPPAPAPAVAKAKAAKGPASKPKAPGEPTQSEVKTEGPRRSAPPLPPAPEQIKAASVPAMDDTEQAEKEEVLSECREYLSGRQETLLSMLGMALTLQSRSYLRRAKLKLKDLLASFPNEFRLKEQSVIWQNPDESMCGLPDGEEEPAPAVAKAKAAKGRAKSDVKTRSSPPLPPAQAPVVKKARGAKGSAPKAAGFKKSKKTIEKKKETKAKKKQVTEVASK